MGTLELSLSELPSKRDQIEINRIVHITPQLPPVICGVGDFATVVGRRMAEHGQPSVSWVSCGGESRVRSCDEFWSRCIQNTNLSSSDVLILHYTGYGYSPDGLPYWVAEALERRPGQLRTVRIVTFFHELYANGKIWQRSFWLSRKQKFLAIRIAKASDALLTNRGGSARWLEIITQQPVGSVPYVPICSNVGEPSEIGAWKDRPKRAITFGSIGFKKFALSSQAEQTCRFMRSLDIRELVDVGQDLPHAVEVFRKYGIEVKRCGPLPASSISNLMAESQIAFLDYNPEYLEKSSIFAAFAAHGLAIVMPFPMHEVDSSLAYASLDDDACVEELEALASKTWIEYQKRSSIVHAQTMLNLVTKCERDDE